MKKLLVVSAIAALGLSSVASAGGLPEPMPMAPVASSDMGVYVGVSGGWGITHWKDVAVSNVIKVQDDTGFVGRGFVGLDLNRYFAIEAGYTHFFNKVEFKEGAVKRGEVKTQVIDLMFKGKLPVVENFDLYAKLGAAYLMSNFDGVAGQGNDRHINVAFGAGADYYITPNIIANVEWLRFTGKSKLNVHYQPYTDAFLVGLRYKFEI